MLSKCRQITVKHLINRVVSSSSFVGILFCEFKMGKFIATAYTRLSQYTILPIAGNCLWKWSRTFLLLVVVRRANGLGVVPNHFLLHLMLADCQIEYLVGLPIFERNQVWIGGSRFRRSGKCKKIGFVVTPLTLMQF